jgi:hypothetical protein
MAGATPTPTGCGRRGDMWAHVPGIEEGGFWVLTIVRHMQYGPCSLPESGVSDLEQFATVLRFVCIW